MSVILGDNSTKLRVVLLLSYSLLSANGSPSDVVDYYQPTLLCLYQIVIL